MIERCKTRPIAHVAAEMGISRATASKWVNRYRRRGELGLIDRSSTPHHQPSATPVEVVTLIEEMRCANKRSATRITHELPLDAILISRRTVTRHLAVLGLNGRKFLGPHGTTDRELQTITARRPGHMVHGDVKKAYQILDGGGVSTVAEVNRQWQSSAGAPSGRRRRTSTRGRSGTPTAIICTTIRSRAPEGPCVPARPGLDARGGAGRAVQPGGGPARGGSGCCCREPSGR